MPRFKPYKQALYLKSGKRRKAFTIQLPSKIYEMLDLFATEQKTSMSFVIEQLLNDFYQASIEYKPRKK